MKRRMICAAVLAALVVPAIAVAAQTNYTGSFSTGGAMGFTAVKKSGKIKSVKEFQWADFKVTCDEGTNAISGGVPKSMKVSKGKFGTTFTGDGGVKVTASGHFRNHGKKATGTVSVLGGSGHCSTQPTPWTAKVGSPSPG